MKTKNWIQLRINKTKKDYWFKLVSGLLSIVDGLVTILSIGTLWGSFQYEHMMKSIIKDAKIK